jgi:CBS domain-containing protein
MQKRIDDIKVKEVMSRDAVCVSPGMRLAELCALFRQLDYNAFPVTEDEQLVGIVTKLDLMRVFEPGRGLSKADLLGTLAETVDDIMTSGVVVLDPDDGLDRAVQLMVENRLRSLPVARNGRVVGIISRGDLMRHMTVS